MAGYILGKLRDLLRNGLLLVRRQLFIRRLAVVGQHLQRHLVLLLRPPDLVVQLFQRREDPELFGSFSLKTVVAICSVTHLEKGL